MAASKAKVLLLPNAGFLSETTRMLAIANALHQVGATVTIAALDGPYAHLLRGGPVPFRPLALPPQAGESAVFHRRFLAALLSVGGEDLPFYDDTVLAALIRQEIELFQELAPDVVVSGFQLSAAISTQICRIPLATSHGGSFVPPVLAAGLCPAPVNPIVKEMHRLPHRVQRALANRATRWMRAPVACLNRAAAAFGVAGVPSFAALLCGDLTLVTDVPEVLGITKEKVESWRPWLWGLRPGASFRMTGPLYARLDLPLPPRVERFLDDRSSPVVYVALTSSDERLVRQVVAGVREAGARVLVAQTIHDVADLEADDVLAEPILASEKVFKRVAAAVLMGGQGSVQTAIAAGIPFVGFPLHGEQELNVAVAERLGMALRLAPASASTAALPYAVRRLCVDPTFRNAAKRASAYYEGVDGAANAAEAILNYSRGRTRSNQPGSPGSPGLRA